MKTILTVDDSRTIRRIIRALFSGYDCRIIEAVNGVDGLNKAQEHKPDIILLDVSMPRMNGKEVLKRLQSSRELFTIPVIMLTAEGDKQAIYSYLQEGACGFIIKPFEKEYLKEKVVLLTKMERTVEEA